MPRDSNYQRDRGERQKERILALVAIEPKTAKQLAEGIHLTLTAILLHTKAMLRETPRRLHIAGWVPSPISRPAPLYGPGDLPDVAYVPVRKPKLPDRVEARLLKMTELLQSEPMTAECLSKQMILAISRVRVYLRQLRDEKKIHIKSWAPPPGRGDLSPVYALGNRQDAPKPRQTRADRYLKEIDTPEKHERLLAKRRVRHYVKKHTKRPQGVFAALGL